MLRGRGDYIPTRVHWSLEHDVNVEDWLVSLRVVYTGVRLSRTRADNFTQLGYKVVVFR